MKFRAFRYPIDGDLDLRELNEFLASQRIINVRQDWVSGDRTAVLVFVVEYTEAGSSGTPSRNVSRSSADAVQGLDEVEAALFNGLRDRRKQWAQTEGVPVWTVFSNEAFRLIVRARPTSITELAVIPGVGQARAEKYGEQILGIFHDALASSGSPASAAPAPASKRIASPPS